VPYLENVAPYFENIEGYEGFNAEPYDDKGRLSVGYGTIGQPGQVVTEEQARQAAENHIRTVVLPQARKAIPQFDSLPENVRIAIVNGWYRGDMGGSPKTLALINEGRWAEAADEYLDHDEYRAAKASGSGVAARMEANAAALRSMADQSARFFAYQDGGMVGPGGEPIRPQVDPMFESGMADQLAISGGAGDDTLAGAGGSGMFREPPSAFSASGEPSPNLVRRRMQRYGETEEDAKDWLRTEWNRRQQNTAALAKAAGGLRISTPSTPSTSSPYRVGVVTPDDFQFGMGAYEPLQLPTPEAPQAAGFDFSRRAQALQEKEAYMQRAMQLAGIDAYLSGNPSQLRTLQAEYAQLGNERALVAGVNALQAATMGDITPLRQFLADQYGTGDVQIYPMADGTLEIEVNGQSLGRTTLADIRQQLLADLDPATQQAAAAQAKFQQELYLKALPEWFKAAQARGEIKDARFIEPADTKAPPFLYYNRGGINYMVPMTTTTINGVETIRFGEEQPIGSVQ